MARGTARRLTITTLTIMLFLLVNAGVVAANGAKIIIGP